MATIGQYLSLITNAVYGEEVRSAIVNAIQQCYTDATDVVKVSETEPTSENTRIWIKPTTDECKVPTWEEHEALNDEVSDLKSALSDAIDDLGENLNNLFNPHSVVIGMNPAGATNYPKRALSEAIKVTNPSIIKAFYLPSNLKYQVYYYSDSQYTQDGHSDWITSADVYNYTQSSQYIRILFGSVDDNALTENDFAGLKLQINTGTTAYDWTPYISADDYKAREIDRLIYNGIVEYTNNLFNPLTIVIGQNAAGNTGFPKRAISGPIPVSNPTKIKAYNLPANLQYMVYRYDGKGFPGSAYINSWTSDDTVINYTGEYPYIRILFGRSDNVNLSESDFAGLKLQINTGSEIKPWTPYVTAKDAFARAEYTKLRLMEYNIGHYCKGSDWSGDDKHGLDPATADRYISGMKELFGKYRPDILFMEEYTQHLIHGDNTSNANTTIFDPLFKYWTNKDSIWNTLRSSYVLSNIKSAYLIDHDVFKNAKPYRYGEILINGHIVALCVVHMVAVYPDPSSSEFDNLVEARAYELENALALFDNKEYGILAGDFNCEETGEKESMNAAAIAKGFTPVNGGYFGWKKTWNDSNPSKYIDNFYVKGDIIIKNFEVLYDEVTDLPSDHIPLITDIAIY